MDISDVIRLFFCSPLELYIASHFACHPVSVRWVFVFSWFLEYSLGHPGDIAVFAMAGT